MGAELADTPTFLEDFPHNLRTSGEWSTTSVPIQLHGTWDSIREAENPAWPGSQIPSGQRQHLDTLGADSADTPKAPRGQLPRQTLFLAPDIRVPSLPEERCPPGLEEFAWASAGDILIPRLHLD